MDKLTEQSSDTQGSRTKGSKKILCLLARILKLGIPMGVLALTWWYYISPWIDSVESRIALTHTAQKNSARLNDVQALQAQVKNLTAELDQLKSKLTLAIKNDEAVNGLSKKLIELEHKVEGLGKIQNSPSQTGGDAWKQDIVRAIQTGTPLTVFRENPAVPQRIRSVINNIDFLPSWGYILEEWNLIKGDVRFSVPSVKIASESPGWWEGFKTFIRGAFRIQRLNKDNKTPEEAFCYQVAVFLSDKDIPSLISLLEENKSKVQLNAQSRLLAWAIKLDLYRKGQEIIQMVKHVND